MPRRGCPFQFHHGVRTPRSQEPEQFCSEPRCHGAQPVLAQCRDLQEPPSVCSMRSLGGLPPRGRDYFSDFWYLLDVLEKILPSALQILNKC